jgi:hypothetical protein
MEGKEPSPLVTPTGKLSQIQTTQHRLEFECDVWDPEGIAELQKKLPV